MSTSNTGLGEIYDLGDFDERMFVGTRLVGLSISETAGLQGFSCTNLFRVYKELCEKQTHDKNCHPLSGSYEGGKNLADERGQGGIARLI